MGNIIRLTITITIIETWITVWTDAIRADEKTQRHATSVIQNLRTTKEKQDETIQAALIATLSDMRSASDPTPPLLTPNLATARQSDDLSTRGTVGKKGVHNQFQPNQSN